MRITHDRPEKISVTDVKIYIDGVIATAGFCFTQARLGSHLTKSQQHIQYEIEVAACSVFQKYHHSLITALISYLDSQFCTVYRAHPSY